MIRHIERHKTHRIGWLRAAVLGANDGIVSTASLVLGVAAAGATTNSILVAGVAGLMAGSMSMAAGEYVSVSSQSDTENADIEKERNELATDPVHELEELTMIYIGRGLDKTLAREVAVQLTATDGTAAGYVSLVPDAGLLGRTSSLNIDEAGETIANSAVVPIGPDGSIVMYTMSPTHLVLDLAGWWTPTTAASAAGRFEPIGPARFLDTRPDSRVGHTGGKPAAGSITTIQVTGRSGVPAIGVSAVVLNVTIDAPESLGFVQVAPAATLTPGTSSTLNVGAIGKVMAASTIVPVDADGRIAVYAQPSTHLIVDVAGYITGDGAPVALDGMFVTLDRIDRALDSRGFSGTDPRVTAGGRRQIFSAGSAVVGNLAVTSTGGPGFVQLGPNDSMVNGATSNINPTRAEETVANAFIVPTGGGAIGLYTSVDTHVIVDVSGYMTS